MISGRIHMIFAGNPPVLVYGVDPAQFGEDGLDQPTTDKKAN